MTLLLSLFILVALVNSFGEFLPAKISIRKITTPVAVPVLMIWLLTLQNIPFLLLLGLVFSTMGDLFLMMPEERNRKRFLWGTLAFMGTHLIYLYYFLSNWEQWPQLQWFQWAGALVLLLATFMLVMPMRNSLKSLLVPVALYSLLLTLLAIAILFSMSVLPFNLFLISLAGILLFLLSDSVLSQDWFIREFPAARFIAMITYFGAQFLLVYAVAHLH